MLEVSLAQHLTSRNPILSCHSCISTLEIRANFEAFPHFTAAEAHKSILFRISHQKWYISRTIQVSSLMISRVQLPLAISTSVALLLVSGRLWKPPEKKMSPKPEKLRPKNCAQKRASRKLLHKLASNARLKAQQAKEAASRLRG